MIALETPTAHTAATTTRPLDMLLLALQLIVTVPFLVALVAVAVITVLDVIL